MKETNNAFKFFLALVQCFVEVLAHVKDLEKILLLKRLVSSRAFLGL